MFYLLYMKALSNCCGDKEINLGPKKSSLTFCHWNHPSHWNLNGIAVHDVIKMSLLRGYITDRNFDTICLPVIVNAPFWVSSIKISNNNRASKKFIVYMIHKSIWACTKIFKLVLILTWWSVDTIKETLFIFRTNFSYQTVP